MPSYAPNFTARARVKYRAGGGVHTQTWRCPGAGTLNVNISALFSAVENVWLALQPVLYDDTQCLACSYAVENTNVFLPFTTSDILGDGVTPTDDPAIKAAAVSFVGRTTTGQPAKAFFYGLAKSQLDVPNGTDFRLSPGENADVDSAITGLNSFFAGLVMCGSDGAGIVWYPYANRKPNDYWVKRVRQGA